MIQIGLRTWKTEVKRVMADRDRRKWQEGMNNKSTPEELSSKKEKKFELWLDRGEGRTVFKI